MAIESTGIVWANNVAQSGLVIPLWNSTGVTGVPNQVWGSRAIDSAVNDTSFATSAKWYGFGGQFDAILPQLMMLRGIKAYVIRKADALTASDSVVQFGQSYAGGSATGGNKALTSTFWPEVADPGVTQIYGAEDDLWGIAASIARIVFTNAAVCIALGQQWENNSGNIYIDAVGIELFYEEIKTTAPLFPSSASSTGWTSPDNAQADDANYATRTFSGMQDPGVATAGVYLSDFGANIPPGSTVFGCGALVGRFATTAGIRDRFLQLHQNGTLLGANKWVSGSNWGTGSTGTVAYGNAATDDWSVPGGLTPELINDSTFGLVIEARNNNASARQGNIDFATLEFHYIEPDHIEGTFGATLTALAATSAAQLAIEGVAGVVLAPLTGVGDGRLLSDARTDISLVPLTAAGEGALVIGAALGSTLVPLTATGLGWFTIVGQLSATFDPLAAVATGDVTYEGGVANIFLMPLTPTAAAILAIEARAVATLAPLTAMSEALLPITGQAGTQLQPLSCMAGGLLFLMGALGSMLAPLTGQAAGVLIVVGAASGLFAALTLTADGGIVLFAVLPNDRIYDMAADQFADRIAAVPADLLLNRIIDQE